MTAIAVLLFLAEDLSAQQIPRIYFTDTSSGKPIVKDPKIVHFKDKYRMYYSIPGKAGAGWHIGVARHTSLVDRQKVGALNATEAYEKNGLCGPGALVRSDMVGHLIDRCVSGIQ